MVKNNREESFPLLAVTGRLLDFCMGVSLGQQVLQEQPWKRVLATQVSAVGGSGTSCLYL